MIKEKDERDLGRIRQISDKKPKTHWTSSDDDKEGWFSDLEILELTLENNDQNKTLIQ